MLSLKELQDLVQQEIQQQEAEDQAWWDSLNQEQRAQAFRQVIKLVYQAEVKERGTYRTAVYDVFGVDYWDGMSHYMDIHNLLAKATNSHPS